MINVCSKRQVVAKTKGIELRQRPHAIGRQSRTLFTIDERVSKIARNSVFDCHLSPYGRQMVIENSVSNYIIYTYVDSITFSIVVSPI